MKYYSQYRIHDLFELQGSLSGQSKSNRWVKLADRLPWAKIEKEYNKRLRNSLTSSLRHPKILIKEFSYFLMPCHQHGLRINLLV